VTGTRQRAPPIGSRTIVRLQAFHSGLLICVATSHNAMHCCNVALPPWAVTNAASLRVIEPVGASLVSGR
jgi:hypothetical protein